MLREKSFSKIFFSTFLVVLCLLLLMAGVVVFCVGAAQKQSEEQRLGKLLEAPAFVPDASDGIRLLAVFDSSYANANNYYVLITYQPDNNLLAIAPIPWQLTETVGVKKRTLDGFFDKETVQSVLKSISAAFSCDIKKYIILTSEKSAEFVDEIGGINFNVEKDICYGDEFFYVSIRAGEQLLNGKMTVGLCENPENFKDSTGCDIIARLSQIIFDKFKNKSSQKTFEETVTELLSTSKTNLTYEDYIYRTDAFDYSAKNNIELKIINPQGSYKVLSDIFTPDEKYIQNINSVFR